MRHKSQQVIANRTAQIKLKFLGMSAPKTTSYKYVNNALSILHNDNTLKTHGGGRQN